MSTPNNPEELAHRNRGAALAELRRAHEQSMLTVAAGRFGGRNVVKNGHDAKEAVDKAFEQFDKANFIETKPPAQHGPLLRHIALLRAIDMTKRSKPTSALPDHDHHPMLGTDEAGYDAVDEADELARRHGRLKGVLADLKPKQAEALDRLFLRQESTKDAAEAMGLSERRIGQLRDEAFERLRRKHDASATRDATDDTNNQDDETRKGGKS